MILPDRADALITRQQFVPSSPLHEDLEEQCIKSQLAARKLEELTYPPGLVGSIIDWCEKTSERPSRPAALGAALGFVAALAGRRFASPTDLRTNLYILLLAESGFGKDHARQAVKRLAIASDLKRFLGAGRVMSTTALRNSVMSQPAQLMMIDEFHTTMAMITDRRSSFSQLLAGDLLELFASANTYFAGAEYAATKAADIQNPNLCIYGTTTPDAFWASAGSQSITSGFLPRVILLNIEGPKPQFRVPEASLREVPSDLIAACKSIVKGNIELDGNTPRNADVVVYGDGATSVLGNFRERTFRVEAQVDATARVIVNRAIEHAVKMAVVVAVGVSAENPVITREIMDWACELAWYSTCTLIAETRDRVTDNQREADYNRVLKLIKQAGENGLKPSAIPDRTRSIDKRRRLEILDDLQASGRIVFKPVQTKKGLISRWVFAG
ncbi:hypothetical protein AB7645_38105 [Bradyrhizobium sp. 956_D2_N1_5]|uniref:hypothetical protein n=1 Tax=unclassified Bradyrhizobium TaxID=2631580 RepID=UPI003F232D90